MLASVPTASWAAARPAPVQPAAPVTATSREAQTYAAWVATFASKEFEGRGVGTKGLIKARDLIAAHFESIGLAGAFKGERTQEFQVSGGVKPVRQELSIAAGGDGGETKATPGTDFVPFGFSGSKAFRGEAVFVGYAISSTQRKYNSLGESGKDAVRGKVAIALRYEPHDEKGKSLWAGSGGSWSRSASLSAKVSWAQKHGAVALLIVNPPSHSDEGLISTKRTRYGRAKIPVVHISDAMLQRILARSAKGAETFEKLVAKANTTGRVDPLGVTLAGHVETKPYQVPLHNVGAVLPGSGELADEIVIVGAHYDHIGMGWTGKEVLHPGADDNASGAAGVMMLAKWYAARTASLPAPRRTIVFVTFAGEEIGLHGSRHLATHPEDLGVKAEQVSAMLNMDMIGRLEGNRLGVWGTGSGEGLHEFVTDLSDRTKLDLRLSRNVGPSDHASFYAVKIPVLNLITGVHRDMHRPTDTPDKINSEGAVKVLRFAEALIEGLATRSERIAYAAPSKQSKVAYLGVMLEDVDGRCVLTRVVPDGPADQAKLKGGDVLITWGGKAITGTAAVRAKLRTSRPDQFVRVSVLRGEQKLDFLVKLGRR